MGSMPQSLPVISLKSASLKDDIYKACKDIGFFYLTDHGIPEQYLKTILRLSREFFLQAPESEKVKIQRKPVEDGGDGARGYQVLNENVTKGKRDYHEAVDFYREWDDLVEREIRGTTVSNTVMDGLPPHKFLRGPNLWPEYPHLLKDMLQDYTVRCQVVGTAVVKAMGEALGEGDVFVRSTRNSFWVMRMIGYPPLSADDAGEGISCGEHTDYGCVTLLLADDTKGALQVQMKDGSWIDADPIPNAFVVNIGDMMENWSNGEWKSTNHRVIHRAREEAPLPVSDLEDAAEKPVHSPESVLTSNFRVSVPFFFEPDFDAIIEPLPECVKRTGGKPLYQKLVYGKHLTGKVEEGSYLLNG